MLQTLKISNFAIIREALVSFEEDFNILTGETGAGKSIVIDAISLLLGARAKEEDIRTGEEESTVEGLFTVKGRKDIKDLLTRAGIELESDEIGIKRVISRSGRNKIFINGSVATGNLLSELGKHLVDICAQNENRLLMNPACHIDLLDDYASLSDKVGSCEKIFARYSAFVGEKENLLERHRQGSEKADFLKYLVKEIKDLNLKEGEDEELKGLRKKLQNLEKIRGLAGRVYQAVYSGDGALIEGLKQAGKDLDLLKALDETFNVPMAEFKSIDERLSDIAFELKKYLDGLEFDPGKLEDVEDRLDKTGKIVRKYGSIRGAIERAEEAKQELTLVENFGSEIEKIDSEIKALAVELKKEALQLSEARKKNGKILDEEINKELKTLSMEGAKFRTKIDDLPLEPKKKEALLLDDCSVSRKGKDAVEFYISANVGEDLKPLEHVASLGELSRIMLALKGIFYKKKSSVATFIFDEIDTGIGGKVAEMVGRKLKTLADGKQVICVTHLSQIASYAASHFLIRKEVLAGRTIFKIAKLGQGERKEELARMIGGVEVTVRTKALAEELLSSRRDG